MSRPLRIEYENAVYHVMNRGRGRSMIFHDPRYSALFLQGVAESVQQFGLEVLAYCLMGNHYHLLVRTPLANLNRCMRHINGVYTQRYNKLKKTDGPLFRGRYKAILVDVDNYLLQVSRYIHRNPIETKTPLVNRLVEYIDSSYPAYLNKAPVPHWLNREFVLKAQNTPKKYQAYQAFVEGEDAQPIDEVYDKAHLPAIVGSPEFVAKMKRYVDEPGQEISIARLHEKPSIMSIVNSVARYFKITTNDILFTAQGKSQKNIPRQMAMYLCQQYGGVTLIEMAKLFNVNHYSTISKSIARLRQHQQQDRKIDKAIDYLQGIISAVKT